MRKVLLDTTAYSAIARGDQTVFDAMCDADCIYMSPVVLGELRAGFRGGVRRAENLDMLWRFLDKPVVEIAPITDETSEVYAELYVLLKKAGTPIPINDAWIAAQCLELGAVLISRDSHFRHIPGLRLWH